MPARGRGEGHAALIAAQPAATQGHARPMTLRNQVLVWVGFTVVVIVMIWLFRPILLPFVIGIALAYMLNPRGQLAAALRHQPRLGGRHRAARRHWPSIIGIVRRASCRWSSSRSVGLVARLPGYVGDLQELVQTMAPQLNEWLGPERAAQLAGGHRPDAGQRRRDSSATLTGQLAQSGLTVLNTLAVADPHPGGRVLPAARLGGHGRRHRRPAAARAPPRNPRQCSTRSTARWPA